MVGGVVEKGAVGAACASPASAAAEAGEGVEVGGRWRRGEADVAAAPGEAARLREWMERDGGKVERQSRCAGAGKVVELAALRVRFHASAGPALDGSEATSSLAGARGQAGVG